MAVCKLCGQEMLTADGCTVGKVYVDGVPYERIKCGDPKDFDPEMEEGERCHDCNAMVGQYHHFGCDAERCPVCGEQLISCDCEISFEED